VPHVGQKPCDAWISCLLYPPAFIAVTATPLNATPISSLSPHEVRQMVYEARFENTTMFNPLEPPKLFSMTTIPNALALSFRPASRPTTRLPQFYTGTIPFPPMPKKTALGPSATICCRTNLKAICAKGAHYRCRETLRHQICQESPLNLRS
jgi:hypothetical protein